PPSHSSARRSRRGPPARRTQAPPARGSSRRKRGRKPERRRAASRLRSGSRGELSAGGGHVRATAVPLVGEDASEPEHVAELFFPRVARPAERGVGAGRDRVVRNDREARRTAGPLAEPVDEVG